MGVGGVCDEEPGRDGEKEKRDRQTERRLISWPADNSSFSEPEPCAQGRGGKCVPLSQRVSSSSCNSMAACQSQMHDNKKLGLAI